MTEEKVWHVAVDGKQQGPYSPEEVVAEIGAGRLDARAHVYGPGMTAWEPIASRPEFSSALPANVPPPPPVGVARTPPPLAAAPAPARQKKRRWGCIVLVLVLVAAAVVAVVWLRVVRASEDNTAGLSTFVAKRGPLSISVLEAGTIKAREQLVIKNEPALALLTVTISYTAIGFGIMMASLSKTVFLSASVSASVLIIMTAIGGIMVPRFVMPDVMQKMSLFVPHGWALEGYLSVLVRNQTVAEILPHAGALALFGTCFILFAIVRLHRLNRT